MSIMPAPELRQASVSEYIPCKDECTLAFLAQLLPLFSGFVGPLVIFVAKRDSRFVKFHALQALLWQALFAACVFGGFILMFATMLLQLGRQHGTSPSNPPPAGFFVGFVSFWLVIMLSGAVNLTLTIVFGIFAIRGEWRKYPLLGGIALRIVNR